ncbi:MAG TPA: NAD(P)-dependent alcohol dehydrogenase, partial [Chryseolinea sp.]|nr:NAD(P)-dependent alcohol dehydrogenase [Chryseolinea sp.]
RGEPVFVRLWGMFKPKHKIPGSDIAGQVEAVGSSIKKFKPGDEVYGDIVEHGWGGFAEYACAHEHQLVLKPASMSYEQAAAIPQAGLLALQSIRDVGRLQKGQRMLLNGAGGSVGTLGVQIAKMLGAEVTVVDSANKLDLLKTLGADHFIDYQKEDFTSNGLMYDLVVDVVANRPIFSYKKALAPGGQFVMIGGTTSTILKMMTLGSLVSQIRKIAAKPSDRRITMMGYKPNHGLDDMSTYFLAGKVIPVIDKVFALADTAEAFRYFASGAFKGKVVIKIC